MTCPYCGEEKEIQADQSICDDCLQEIMAGDISFPADRSGD